MENFSNFRILINYDLLRLYPYDRPKETYCNKGYKSWRVFDNRWNNIDRDTTQRSEKKILENTERILKEIHHTKGILDFVKNQKEYLPQIILSEFNEISSLVLSGARNTRARCSDVIIHYLKKDHPLLARIIAFSIDIKNPYYNRINSTHSHFLLYKKNYYKKSPVEPIIYDFDKKHCSYRIHKDPKINFLKTEELCYCKYCNYNRLPKEEREKTRL